MEEHKIDRVSMVDNQTKKMVLNYIYGTVYHLINFIVINIKYILAVGYGGKLSQIF